MQWITLWSRADAYLPRSPGEKALLNIVAINVEANSEHEAIEKAGKLIDARRWCLGAFEYEDDMHDIIFALDLELYMKEAMKNGRP